MKNRPYILSETNWNTVKDTEFEIAVLPWGATEPHNYHLPYGTDNFQSNYIAEVSAEIAWDKGCKVIVLPTIPFGVNTTQLDLRLTINLNPSTQVSILTDVIESLEGHGINKLVILNGHGGNDFKAMLREFKRSHPATFICTLNWFQIGNLKDFFSEPGDHAGEMETSNMLYIKPGLVLPLKKAGEGKSKTFKPTGLKEGWVWSPREWTKVTNDTGIGNPKEATKQKGEIYLADITKKIGSFFIELARCKTDEMYE